MTERRKPIAQRLPYRDPLQYCLRLQKRRQLVFLDSAAAQGQQARYSYLAFDPFDSLIYREGDPLIDNIFTLLQRKLQSFHLQPIAGLPPFQGGAAGFFSYDLARDLERLPNVALDDMQYPRLAMGFYHTLLSFDHQTKQAWIVASGANAQARIEQLQSELANDVVLPDLSTEAWLMPDDIEANVDASRYQAAVAKMIDYIKAGDIFEANLTQRFKCRLPDTVTPLELYRRIRASNPAPFAAYVAFDDVVIASSSPERFIQLHDGVVETRPIKGTAKRSDDVEQDRSLAAWLLQSEKDRAENTMIVDLMRNDLSRICLPHSIKVPQYCALESFATVHHLVSVVTGQLRPDCSAVDVLRATFPGGSITGAPKVRAMEIIDELEPTRRGPYCGSIGYIGFDGCMDTSILIRSYVIQQQVVTFQGGGAVVLDSDPKTEYEEALLKVAALRRVLTQA